MSDELPTVSIDGESYWPALLHHQPGTKSLQMATFDEAALSALLAALSPEQRERVLGPYIDDGDRDELTWREKFEMSEVAHMRELERSQTLDHALDSERTIRRALEDALGKAERERDEARKSAIDDAIMVVHGLRRHYPITINENPAHDVLTRAINKLADLRSEPPAPPPQGEGER